MKSTKSKSDGFVASDEEQIRQLQQFNTIATELTSASEDKASWIEFYSALSQAFPEDPRIKAIKDAQSDHRAAPTEIPFSDREELYVDHVESAYFPNLQSWLSDIMPIHEKMFQLDQEEIDKMKKEAEANAESDKKAKEEVDTLNSADAMIFQTESQIKEYGDKIPEDKKKAIEDALDVLKKAHESKDVESIKTALEGINEAWKNASEELYKAQAEAQQASGAGAGQAEPNEKSKDDSDDVQDVDFEEVK